VDLPDDIATSVKIVYYGDTRDALQKQRWGRRRKSKAKPNMFALKYKPDPGLEFLQFCSHEEIKSLAEILINTGGSSEGISSDDNFIKNKDDLKKCWQTIAAELQRFGGNTISNTARIGRGIVYEEIVDDVCGSFGINVENVCLIDKEEKILSASLRRSLETVEFHELIKAKLSQQKIDIQGVYGIDQVIKDDVLFAYKISIEMIERIINYSGEYELNQRISKPDFRVRGGLFKSIIGVIVELAFAGIATGLNQADPAFRVTIPAIIQIGYLRRNVMSRSML
jgi:uncharacterized protein YaaW (UPF0174 family)